MSSISKTIEKLRNPEYRSGFVDSLISINVPFQIRALVKSRGWTQEQLAERSGMLQPRISAIMTPGKTRPNIKTLRRIAEAFDCGLMVRFVPFSELVTWTHRFDPENFQVASFKEELERKEELATLGRIPESAAGQGRQPQPDHREQRLVLVRQPRKRRETRLMGEPSYLREGHTQGGMRATG